MIIILRILLIAAGAALVLTCFIPVLFNNHFHIGVLSGMGVGALFIIYGIWATVINSFIARCWHSIVGKIIELLLLVICVIILTLAVITSSAMIKGASMGSLPSSTLLVLGAKTYSDHPSLTLRNRLDAAISYLEADPDAVCIVSGGQGKDEPAAEASVMRSYLMDKGISPERIYTEDKSTDTRENMEYSKELIEKENLNPDITIVTDGYHAYRAGKYAERSSLNYGTYPSVTVWYLFPSSVIREMYGILELWLINR